MTRRRRADGREGQERGRRERRMGGGSQKGIKVKQVGGRKVRGWGRGAGSMWRTM